MPPDPRPEPRGRAWARMVRRSAGGLRAFRGRTAAGGGGSRPESVARAILRRVALGLAILLPAACWGVATASAEASLGPHVARYDVTLDHEITVDLGPLGTLVIDSPLPLTLGARVVVQEIPREVTAVEQVDTLAALGEDLQGYVQFFSGPEAALDVAVRALLADAARRTLLAAVLLALAVWGSRVLLGGARRAELSAVVAPYRPVVTGSLVVGLALASTLTASEPGAQDRSGATSASAVFDGTPLEGARITGRLAGVIDTYGGYVVDAYRENEAFYDGAVTALEASWDERAQAEAALEASRTASASPTGRPTAGDTQPSDPGDPGDAADGDDAGEQGAGGEQGEDGAGTGSDAARGSATGAPTGTGSSSTPGTTSGADAEDEVGAEGTADEEAAEPVTVVVVSDLHCNVGMARVIRSVVGLAGADVVLNAGDSTVNGTAVESYCVSAFADAVPSGVPLVIADGNHDSVQTAEQERAAGARVLDGGVVEVAGIRVLGDSDPNATRVGIGTLPVGEETVADAGRRLADVACAEEDGVDLLLVHNPNVGNATLDRGCAPAQISGHLHRRVGPVPVGEGVRYVSTSTAGAALGQATIGPLNGVAEITVLRFDPDAREFMDQRLVRIHPDGSVGVGLAVPWPSPTREDVPGPDEPQ